MSRSRHATDILERLIAHVVSRDDLREAVIALWVDRQSLDGPLLKHVPVAVEVEPSAIRCSTAWAYPIHGLPVGAEPLAALRQALRRADRRLRIEIVRGVDLPEAIAQPALAYAKDDGRAHALGRLRRDEKEPVTARGDTSPSPACWSPATSSSSRAWRPR